MEQMQCSLLTITKSARLSHEGHIAVMIGCIVVCNPFRTSRAAITTGGVKERFCQVFPARVNGVTACRDLTCERQRADT